MRSGTNFQHGKASSMRNYGCHCQDCRDAHAREQGAARQRRIERLAADPTLAEHGRRSTYTNWGCRCEACTEAYTAPRRAG